jgi:hypothetical protein
MPRSISAVLRQALYAQETSEIPVVLATIEHAGLSGGILRLCNHREEIESRGETFSPFGFDVILPSDDEDSPPLATVSFDNVAREQTEWLRSITTAPTILIEIVRLSDPDTLEMRWPRLKLQSPTWPPGGAVITAQLIQDDVGRIMCPFKTYNPADYPGLF